MVYLIATNLLTILIVILLTVKYRQYGHSQKTFQRLMDHTNIGYYKYRVSDGVIVEANRGFVRILELDMGSKDVIGRSLSELLIYVDEKEAVRDRINKSRELKNYEYHFKTLKGKDKWVLHNSYIERTPYGGGKVIVALIDDVTEERLSYEKMRESQQRYERLFKNSGDMVIIYKFDNNIIEEVNPVTGVITGFPEEELIGKIFDNLFHPSHRKVLKEAHQDMLFRGSSRLESVIVCKNGSYKEVILTLSVVDLEEDKIVIAVIKEVSSLVRKREEEKRRTRELEDFWKASVEREERINDLRVELERAKKQIKSLKEKK